MSVHIMCCKLSWLSTLEADDDVHECDFDELCEILYRLATAAVS